MTIFAEADAATWLSVAMALVATAGVGVNLLFAYLTSKDKLRYAAEFNEVKAALEACETQHAECEERRKADHSRIDKLQERADRSERLVSRQEGELASAQRAVKDLRGEVRELRNRLYGGGPPDPKGGGS